MKNPKIKLRKNPFYKHIKQKKKLKNTIKQGGARLVHWKLQNIAERN